MDKVLELLVLCHDHWAGIVAEFYPSGVAEPGSPVMRVDLSFALRSLLLPPSTPKGNSRCVCMCVCVCVRACVCELRVFGLVKVRTSPRGRI